MGVRTLLERDHELSLLDQTLDAAATGRGRLALLEGEAGIGKSALLAHAAQEAERRGFAVHRARAGALERELGFGIARQLFEAPLVRASAAARRALLAGSASLAAPALGLEPAASDAGGEFRFEHGLYWLVANLADRGPVALVVDDAQWADEPSLRWLLYLARRMDGLALAVVVAVRTGEPDAPADLLAALADEGATVRPAALSVDATATLVRSAYGDDVEPEFALACREWTGGNPMFAAELASELAAEGVAPVAASVPRMQRLTPPSIARVTLLRLARLPEAAVALARAAAVLGAAAELRIAAELAGLDRRAAGEAADALAAARVLHPGDPLRFRHPLVAGVVYDDTPPARRAADHDRAARLLAAAGAAQDRVITQLLRSGPGGDPWVVGELLAAAERDLRRGSAATAVALLRRARAEPPAPATLPRVLHRLGLAESLAGDPAAADSLRAALAASADEDERGTIALLLGRLLLRAGRTSEAVQELEPAIEAAGAGELGLQLEATLLTAAALDVRLADAAAPRIARIVAEPPQGDSHGARLIAAQLAWAATASGFSLDVSLELARRALGGGRLIREAPITPDAYLLPILMLALCDALDEADSYCDQALALARESGSAPAYAGTACFRAGIAYLRGRLEDAELLARDAIRLAADAHGLALVSGLAPAYLAGVLVERGDPAAALALLGDVSALEDSPMAWSAELLFAAGRAHVAERRLEEGAELLLACGRRCRAWRVGNPAWLPWRSHAALALHGLGEVERAAELCDDEVRRARRFGAPRPLGVALRAQGLVRGDEELLRESVGVLASSPARLEHARSLVALGGALRRSRRRAEARGPLAEGLELAERSGAAPLAQEARSELRACGARPRSVMRTGAETLTASERRVCEMAADGLSNPEIAQALFVTRATVESHLHSAYRKLDLTSRRQLGDALAGSQ